MDLNRNIHLFSAMKLPSFPLAVLVGCLSAVSPALQAAQPATYRAYVRDLRVASPMPVDNGSSSPAPALTYMGELSTTQVSFDPTLVGTSQTKQVLLSNKGTGVLLLEQPTTTGAPFSSTTTCTSQLAVGDSCLTSVTFSPSSSNTFNGTLTFSTNAQNGPLTVALSGAGTQPNGALTAVSSSSFGTPTLGTAVSRQFTFTNTGTGLVTGVYATLTPTTALTFSQNTCGAAAEPISLAPNSSCSMTVSWAPTVSSVLSASLAVASSAPNSPNTLLLTGSAAPSGVKLQTGGYRTWADSTVATSCLAYLSPSSEAYTYTGDTGSGVYRVDPDGTGPLAPTDVFCDMTSDGGGWTLALKGVAQSTLRDTWSTTGALNVTNLTSPDYTGASAKLADAFINSLKRGTGAYRLEGTSTFFTTPVRYASGACQYNHAPVTYTVFATQRPNCDKTWSDVGLSAGLRTYSTANSSGSYGGIADINSSQPTVTFTTSRYSTGEDNYFIGSGAQNYYESSHGLYKNGGATTKTGGPGASMRMWVR